MRRLCEAPVSPRYVECYRCEAIQCREDNKRLTYRRTTTSTLDCFAAFQCYVSQVRRRLRKDGQGEALPCPGAVRRDGGRGLRNPGEASLAPTKWQNYRRKPSSKPKKPPSLEGGAARRRRGVPRAPTNLSIFI
ncbi:MAG: hypothetical protein LBM98_07615 [Oscillospiraceae bacterium]|nr:hypothetical protein [Oscillospiraceae bacterium]